MRLLVTPGIVELGAPERHLSLGVGGLALPAERRKLFPPSTPHRFHQFWVKVAHEVVERRRLTVLLPHKQERNGGREEHHTGCELEALEGDQLAQALTVHP